MFPLFFFIILGIFEINTKSVKMLDKEKFRKNIGNKKTEGSTHDYETKVGNRTQQVEYGENDNNSGGGGMY